MLEMMCVYEVSVISQSICLHWRAFRYFYSQVVFIILSLWSYMDCGINY